MSDNILIWLLLVCIWASTALIIFQSSEIERLKKSNYLASLFRKDGDANGN